MEISRKKSNGWKCDKFSVVMGALAAAVLIHMATMNYQTFVQLMAEGSDRKWRDTGSNGPPSIGNMWKTTDCGNVHNLSYICWKDSAIPLKNLPGQKQWHVQTSKDILRVAIQRHPYE